MEKLDLVAAPQIVPAALAASLIEKLIDSGAISDDHARHMDALLLIDAGERSAPRAQIYRASREIIKDYLEQSR